jgi:phosphatidylglycerol:prolipoprotein diacylglycerol transferase
MRPVLLSLRLGSHQLGLHTYGVLIAMGLAAGIAVAYREARRQGFDGGRVLDLAFWMTVAGLVGSRLAYGVVNLGSFARACAVGDGEPRRLATWISDCTGILHVWQGGLVFYGGVAGAVAVAAWFARRERWSFWTIGDVFAPGLALGHAFGRLGCFAAGCCFGKASTVPWGVAFPRGSVAFDELASAGAVAPGAALTPALHPTQLYEAAGELALFALLVRLRPRLREKPGALLLAYAAGYGLLRFAVETFRGDFARRYVAALPLPRVAAWLRLPAAEPVLLSVGQLMSVIVLIAAAVAWRQRRRSWSAGGAAAQAASATPPP